MRSISFLSLIDVLFCTFFFSHLIDQGDTPLFRCLTTNFFYLLHRLLIQLFSDIGRLISRVCGLFQKEKFAKSIQLSSGLTTFFIFYIFKFQYALLAILLILYIVCVILIVYLGIVGLQRKAIVATSKRYGYLMGRKLIFLLENILLFSSDIAGLFCQKGSAALQ